jgi:serine/threonine protein kinase
VLNFAADEVLCSRYKLHKELGDGGYGTVWLAEDEKLKRQVAIKRLKRKGIVFPDDSGLDERYREDIILEARRISALSHPNIIQVYDVLEADGEALILMEFAPGGSLQALLKQRARERKWVETREALDLIRGILAGLSAAHEQESGGIIHRDLKPANIMLSEEQPKLADFGLAAVGPVDRMPTRAGQRPWHMGTVYFMSPEQMRGEQLDHRSDLFNVGLIAFLLLGMRHPFSDEALLFNYQEMVLEGIRPIPQLQAPSRAVRAFQGWVKGLLHLNPDDRYATAREALQEFEDCVSSWSQSILIAAMQLDERLREGEKLAGSDPARDELAPCEVLEAISLSRRMGNRSAAVRLFERGGFDFSSAPEALRRRAESDYSYCKRRIQEETEA